MKDDSALNGETGKEMFGGITTALDVDTGVSGGGSKTRRNKSAKNKRNKNAKIKVLKIKVLKIKEIKMLKIKEIKVLINARKVVKDKL